MNEKLTDAVLHLIEQLQATAGEQLPLVLAEMLTYYTWLHWVCLGVAMAAMLGTLGGSVIVFKLVRLKKGTRDSEGYRVDTENLEIGCITLWAASGACLLVVLYNASMLIKLSVAPRLYLLEAIRGML